MAASAMALFPFIRTLATVHLYCYLRADQRADSASGAFAIIIEGSRQIAINIQFIGEGNHTLRAKGDTQLASLAKLPRNFNRPFHLNSRS